MTWRSRCIRLFFGAIFSDVGINDDLSLSVGVIICRHNVVLAKSNGLVFETEEEEKRDGMARVDLIKLSLIVGNTRNFKDLKGFDFLGLKIMTSAVNKISTSLI